MSRRLLIGLLAVFAAVLVFGYSALLTPGTDPRPVPTDTPGAGDGEELSEAAAAGLALYEEQCMSCHTLDGGDSIGPTWLGLWGRPRTLEDGTTVEADEAYISESILQPQAKVVEGFQPIMPNFPLSDEEINNLIEFIKTLG